MYFYDLAVLTGSTVTVKNIFRDSLQGDIKFIDILEQLGAKLVETGDGICLTRPENGAFDGIDVDLRSSKARPCKYLQRPSYGNGIEFSLIGTKVNGIKIDNPACCYKTFENYFSILDTITNSAKIT